MISCHIVIQNGYLRRLPFTHPNIKTWAKTTLESTHLPYHLQPRSIELTLRFVTNAEIQTLNAQYRHQDKPTNVLAFPSQVPPHLPLRCRPLGDVVIAPDVLTAEHLQANRTSHTLNVSSFDRPKVEKTLESHWAHILIHGILHLLGHQHENDEDTALMQAEEIRLMTLLNFPNPYPEEDGHLV